MKCFQLFSKERNQMKKKPHRVSGLEDHIVHCVVLREFFLTVACAFRTQVHITFFLLFFHSISFSPILIIIYTLPRSLPLFCSFFVPSLSRSRVLTLSSPFCVYAFRLLRHWMCVFYFFSASLRQSSKYMVRRSRYMLVIFFGEEWMNNNTKEKKISSEWMELREWKSNNNIRIVQRHLCTIDAANAHLMMCWMCH